MNAVPRTRKMKRCLLFVALACLVAAPAFAGGINLNGPHYNLNIIGVENPKNSTMSGSDRHTIFVALGSKDPQAPYVKTKIWLTPGDFQVCDGNGLDSAVYDCDGNLVNGL